MNSDLIELAAKRGELKAKIAMQRDAVAQHVWPVSSALGAADRTLAVIGWIKRHPGALAAAVAAIVVAKPKRALRWGQRGFFLWKSWRALRSRLSGLL